MAWQLSHCDNSMCSGLFQVLFQLYLHPFPNNSCDIVNNLVFEKRNIYKGICQQTNHHFTKCAFPDVLRWKQSTISVSVHSADMKNTCILCLWWRGESFWQVGVCKSQLIGRNDKIIFANKQYSWKVLFLWEMMQTYSFGDIKLIKF